MGSQSRTRLSVQAHMHNYKELAHMIMEAGMFEDLQGE